jgi:feruloyl-CoA synthase
VAQRGPDGAWRRISYAQMLERVRRIGQALAVRGLSPERPIAILSDNDLEHYTLALAALWVGVPYTPVSVAYSTVSQDFGKLKQILGTLNPGLIFAADGHVFRNAIATVVPADTEVWVTSGEDTPALQGRKLRRFDSVLADTEPGAEELEAHGHVGPDTIAKFLFTSGSTKQPKGVINTQRMICANQQMLRQCFAFLADEPPVLVDWLPWNHTFGGNHNVGIALYNGGTLYIDDGKPTPKGMAATLRNLREIAPTIYFNVPKGFEEIARAMDGDTALRDKLFSRVKAFMFAGAGLSQAVWDHLDRHAEAAVGERICIFTGLGMTETAPSCTFALGTDVRSGHIGLPAPGVQIKLVPVDGKLEVRFKGPNVMPGYWRAPAETAAAFDDEGYYRTGDAVLYVDDANPQRGLRFDGRIAEDFKLSTGTFVNVGPLRMKIVLAGDPLVQDVVLAGLNRDELGALIFPRLDDAKKRFGLPAEASAAQVLAHPDVRGFFQALVDRLWAAGTGSANRVARAIVLEDAPHIDRGEVTDKGSINQRAVLAHRADLVERLYAEVSGPQVLLPRR